MGFVYILDPDLYGAGGVGLEWQREGPWQLHRLRFCLYSSYTVALNAAFQPHCYT